MAVLISLLVSFTLDPMLSSIWHDPHAAGAAARGRLAQALARFEAWMDRQAERYAPRAGLGAGPPQNHAGRRQRCLSAACCWRPWWAASLCPKSDTGKFIVKFKTAPGSSLEYTEAKAREVEARCAASQKSRTCTAISAAGLPPGRNQATLRVFTTPRPSVNAACLPCLPHPPGHHPTGRRAAGIHRG